MTSEELQAIQTGWIKKLKQENDELLAALVSVCKQLHGTQKALEEKNKLLDTIRLAYHEMNAEDFQEHVNLLLI